VIALVCDGLGALVATHITKGTYPPSAFHIQVYLSLWSFCIVLFYAVVVKHLSFVVFLEKHPEMLIKLVKLAALSGVGQLFIFATITAFDPLALSVITTTRKMLTIVFSAFWFNHSLHGMQWFAVGLLFAGLLWSDILELVNSYVLGKPHVVEEEEIIIL
jgi:drug/metabolite transporter (DMT)-like permease